ncbi:MAG: VWA domain-containing protein [Pyrinomonadaceae bacterium]
MNRLQSTPRNSLTCFATIALVCCVSFPFFASKQQQQQGEDEDVVRVNTDLIVLNATIVDSKGEYLHHLRRADFELREDGNKQTISNFSVEETPFAAVVLLDTSGSMEERLSIARAAAISFLDGLRTDDAAAVYKFDSKIEQVQDFSQSRDLAPLAYGLRAKGMTVLNDAVLRAANDLSARPEKRRAIIVLSDGADTQSSASKNKALERVLAVGATVYTVDMSDTSNPAARAQGANGSGVLRDLAVKSGGRYIATPGGRTMREAFAQIIEELNNQYTIAYQSTNRLRDGRWRSIELHLSRPPDAIIRTRKGYRAPKS